ncbi:M20/M25/M40 family metallo-hydrolase [Selenihalanaerobacter shriftii]|uniref:Peptidase T-like protein n=1 Tax=Selenihalanaerobacter shriftii TaxID=142842 RepID=A0A1T4M4A9_9FIRM|nr:M20/M25/M40 family metallo-hydrolase [Selenihalanaerobacter shriftii]SJZ61830.1 peptidase T-like protein [Selenihalanaerobacter shriftii]
MIDETRIVDEFMGLLKIDSESRTEREIADKLKERLEKLGLEVREDDIAKEVEGNTGNIIAKLEGNNSEVPTLFLSAHMDTVKPGKGVKPIIKDDTIYSAGDTILGADDKAGIAAILASLEYLIENDSVYGDVEVVFTVCEEVGLLGAKNLAIDKLEADLGIVYDSGGEIGTIIAEAPAQDKINVIVNGKSAHAGIEPDKGINAIKVASIALSNMNLGRVDEETTANIGVIKGGKATNIVPDRVELEGEARSRDEEKLNAQTQHMVDIFEKSAKKFNAKVEIEVERLFPAFKLDKNSPIVKAAIKAAKDLNVEPKLVPTGGGSDANIFNVEIPTINLGIGMADVHTTDEHIKINDLIKTAEYTLTIIEKLN